MTKEVVKYDRPLSAPVQSVAGARALLLANEALIGEHLAKVAGLTVELVVSTAISAIATAEPKTQALLLQCSGQSILKSAADAARYGLVLGGAMGQCYFVPFKDKCTLVVGYRGYEALAYRSGQVRAIQSGIVYEGDSYLVNIGKLPPILHQPAIPGDHRDDKIVAAYAIAWIGADLALAEHMNRQDLDHIRAKSKMANFGAYVTDLAEMFRKAPIRRLCKHVNLSPSDHAILDEIASTEDARNGVRKNNAGPEEADKRAAEVLKAVRGEAQPPIDDNFVDLSEAAEREARERAARGGN